jgi:hypothetical protein
VKKIPPSALEPEATHYVNVALDIYAASSLDGFVQALGDKVLLLYVGGSRRNYEAHMELASSHMDIPADDTILGLIDLIRGLPRVHRKTWDSAKRREFNVGIEAGLEPTGLSSGCSTGPCERLATCEALSSSLSMPQISKLRGP